MNELTQNTNKVIRERFDILLPEIQNVILDDGLEEYMLYALDAAGLPESLEPELENEVVMLLMGFSTIEDLAENVGASLKIDQNTANHVVSVLNETFFTGLEEYLSLMSAEFQKPEDATDTPQKEPPSESLSATEAPVETAPVPTETEPAPEPVPAPASTPIPSYKKPLTDVPRYDTPAADPYKMQPESEENGESESEGDSGTENGGGNTAQRW